MSENLSYYACPSACCTGHMLLFSDSFTSISRDGRDGILMSLESIVKFMFLCKLFRPKKNHIYKSRCSI